MEMPHPDYPKLFEPLDLGFTTLPNRVGHLPVRPCMP